MTADLFGEPGTASFAGPWNTAATARHKATTIATAGHDTETANPRPRRTIAPMTGAAECRSRAALWCEGCTRREKGESMVTDYSAALRFRSRESDIEIASVDETSPVDFSGACLW